jgi:hypothetical protein
MTRFLAEEATFLGFLGLLTRALASIGLLFRGFLRMSESTRRSMTTIAFLEVRAVLRQLGELVRVFKFAFLPVLAVPL